MNPVSPIRKIYQGVADRRQMFRMFDRHAQRPNRLQDDVRALYGGEWFEIDRGSHDYMLDILPPLWMRGEMFALREFLTDSITSIFFALKIDGNARYFHSYCDLAEKSSPGSIRDAIVERESRPVRVMTHEERLEHIWSSTHDEYRGFADWRFPRAHRGRRTVMNFGPDRNRAFKLLDQLTDAEIAAKLPVHLRHLPEAVAA
ncbi:MAG: DUF1419 domain-containing protein [Rhizobiaceae bacterium]